MKKKNRLFSLSLVVSLFVDGTLFASSISFDFEGAPFMGVAGDIELYIEGEYGSDVTVTGGRVANWSPGAHGPLGPGPLGPDNYIQAGPASYCPSSWFSFSFNEVPITSVSFDWGTKLGVDFPIILPVYSFDVSADGDRIFSRECSFEISGESGVISFSTPVTTLEFTVGPSSVFEIEVDNLTVTPVPEPATITILFAGMLALTGRRRRQIEMNS